MSIEDQLRWDKQHQSTHGSEEPSSFLAEMFAAEAWAIPRGLALDIACGKGRNAFFLAEQGFDVVAVDISPVALEEGRKRAAEKKLTITWEQADLEQIRLGERTYYLVVNFNYLQRSLIPQIKAALKPGGYVIFETYLMDPSATGHPRNPAYLLHETSCWVSFAISESSTIAKASFPNVGSGRFVPGSAPKKSFSIGALNPED